MKTEEKLGQVRSHVYRLICALYEGESNDALVDRLLVQFARGCIWKASPDTLEEIEYHARQLEVLFDKLEREQGSDNITSQTMKKIKEICRRAK